MELFNYLHGWVMETGGIAAGDFNRDGKTDVVYAVGGSPSSLAVQLGSGDGNFTGSQTYTIAFNPSSLVMADVNGDGSLDRYQLRQHRAIRWWSCSEMGMEHCKAGSTTTSASRRRE